MAESSNYRITHHTRYRYPEPVAISQNQLRMFPREMGRVTCQRVEIEISPEPELLHRHQDYFGNGVVSFAIESLHRQLDVTVRSEVTVNGLDGSQAASPAWEELARRVQQSEDANWFEAQGFCYDSPRIRRDEVFADYARESFSSNRPLSDALLELTQRIQAEFRYDPAATNVTTSTKDVFRIKAGVCQDFAHVQVACLRSLGLPARYVSGYLRTEPPEGKPRLVGADESHAWVAAYAGQECGWLEVDPTNACLVSTDHIPICIGRDYSEVTPMRGVVLGGGNTDLRVSVDVEPMETVSQD